MSVDVLNTQQVADLLGVEVGAVEAAAGNGLLPHRRLGRNLLFVKSVVLSVPVSSVKNYEIGSTGDAIARIVSAAEEMRARIDALCKPANETPNPYLDGYVYAIRPIGTTKPIKIGKAIDPVDRLASIQRMNPWPLDLLGLAHGARNEGSLHLAHCERRLHGEWFGISENPLPIEESCFICRDR